MSEERLKVLEMLSAGKINVEQAGQLLEAFGQSRPVAQPVPAAAPVVAPAPEPQPSRASSRSSGRVTGLTPQQILTMKIHGISADFVQPEQVSNLFGMLTALTINNGCTRNIP